MTYSEKLKNPKWQKKRLKTLDRDNWACQLCGDTETELQVHHKEYSGEPWDAKDENLISYCKYCHFLVEALIDMPDSQLIKVLKYAAHYKGDYLLAGVVHKTETDTVSVFFTRYIGANNDIEDIIFMSPKVIREFNVELDKLKIILNNGK